MNKYQKTRTKLLTILQKIARLRDADKDGYCKCISCGKIEHYSRCDGGHFISRAISSTAFNLDNIHAQCKPCNRFKMVANSIEACNYRQNLIKKIGQDKVENLLSKRQEKVKLNTSILLEKIQQKKQVLKILEEKYKGYNAMP